MLERREKNAKENKIDEEEKADGEFKIDENEKIKTLTKSILEEKNASDGLVNPKEQLIDEITDNMFKEYTEDEVN